jgi:hypothetical protein
MRMRMILPFAQPPPHPNRLPPIGPAFARLRRAGWERRGNNKLALLVILTAWQRHLRLAITRLRLGRLHVFFGLFGEEQFYSDRRLAVLREQFPLGPPPCAQRRHARLTHSAPNDQSTTPDPLFQLHPFLCPQLLRAPTTGFQFSNIPTHIAQFAGQTLTHHEQGIKK